MLYLIVLPFAIKLFTSQNVAGIDTDGGVRIPAAFCGILGFRPSHGAVSTVGVVPMAQSFDTVGKGYDELMVAFNWLEILNLIFVTSSRRMTQFTFIYLFLDPI